MIKKKIPFYSFWKIYFLVTSDILAFVVSFLMAMGVRYMAETLFPFIEFDHFAVSHYYTADLSVFVVILLFISGIYELYQKRRTFWEELLLIWKAIIFSCLLSYVILFNFDYVLPFISRLVLLLSFGFLGLMMPLFRFLTKRLLYKTKFWQVPVLLACDSVEQSCRIDHVINAFKKDPYQGFVVKAVYFPNELNVDLPKDFVRFTNLNEIPKHTPVFVLTDTISQQNEMLVTLYSRFRRVRVIPQNMLGLINSKVQYLFTERMFLVNLENQLNSVLSNMIKTFGDYLLGTLIVLALSPFFLVVSLLVKFTSKGPVFYKHVRIGKGGKPFKMWKFRTMHPNADQKLKELLASDPALKAEWDQYFKLTNDPRITPIGNFLRKYSIDEFPQLFNVLRGEMSLIGPRPFIEGELESINPSLAPLYAQVKPGLTGLWQVSGRSDTDRLERLQIDVWYLQNWSPSLDLLILLNTPLAVLTARGAR